MRDDVGIVPYSRFADGAVMTAPYMALTKGGLPQSAVRRRFVGGRLRAPPVADEASKKEWQRSKFEAAASAAHKFRLPQQDNALIGPLLAPKGCALQRDQGIPPYKCRPRHPLRQKQRPTSGTLLLQPLPEAEPNGWCKYGVQLAAPVRALARQ